MKKTLLIALIIALMILSIATVSAGYPIFQTVGRTGHSFQGFGSTSCALAMDLGNLSQQNSTSWNPLVNFAGPFAGEGVPFAWDSTADCGSTCESGCEQKTRQYYAFGEEKQINTIVPTGDAVAPTADYYSMHSSAKKTISGTDEVTNYTPPPCDPEYEECTPPCTQWSVGSKDFADYFHIGNQGTQLRGGGSEKWNGPDPYDSYPYSPLKACDVTQVTIPKTIPAGGLCFKTPVQITDYSVYMFPDSLIGWPGGLCDEMPYPNNGSYVDTYAKTNTSDNLMGASVCSLSSADCTLSDPYGPYANWTTTFCRKYESIQQNTEPPETESSYARTVESLSITVDKEGICNSTDDPSATDNAYQAITRRCSLDEKGSLTSVSRNDIGNWRSFEKSFVYESGCAEGEYCNIQTGDCTKYDFPETGKHFGCNASQQCVQIDGEGTDTCRGNQDCQSASHTVCNSSKACESVPGAGISLCGSNADCQTTHTSCFGGACIQINGAGSDECAENSDCTASHTECNAQKQCETVPGAGTNKCFTSGDCEKTSHTECSGNTCQPVLGAGADQCTSGSCSSAPQHFACNSSAKKCELVPGEGPNTCSTDLECEKTQHLACQEGQFCNLVEGDGADECTSGYDCLKTKHTECKNNSCVSVDGPGADSCFNDWSCSLQHTECNGQKQCVSVPGIGGNNCGSNADCTGETHLGCDGEQCVPLPGGGTDNCFNASDCGDTHTECQNNSCVTVPGGGIDKCGSDPDCAPYYTKCDREQGTCLTIAGTGISECGTDAECDWHLGCNDNQKCVPVVGAGEDVCDSDRQCEPGHTICQDYTCVVDPEDGQDECAGPAQCNPESYLACSNQSCIWTPKINGNEKNECLSSADCTNTCGNGKVQPLLGEQCDPEADLTGCAANETCSTSTCQCVPQRIQKARIASFSINPEAITQGDNATDMTAVIEKLSTDTTDCKLSVYIFDSKNAQAVGPFTKQNILFSGNLATVIFNGTATPPATQPDFDFTALAEGVYNGIASLNCDNEQQGSASDTFSVFRKRLMDVPETNWVGMLAVLFGTLLVIGIANRKK
ncbi:MAG TPA: hypothetical protein VI977_06630 [archaeon]|nr:hypothetical protein [archaeon]